VVSLSDSCSGRECNIACLNYQCYDSIGRFAAGGASDVKAEPPWDTTEEALLGDSSAFVCPICRCISIKVRWMSPS